MRGKIAVLALMALSSCATPPKVTQFDNSKTYAMSKDAVWESLLAFFTSNNVQIKTIEKDSGVIYAERTGVDMSMADCGQTLAADLNRTVSLNVFVRKAANGTEVTVNTTFQILRTFDNATWTDTCHSTGVLEKRILSSIDGVG